MCELSPRALHSLSTSESDDLSIGSADYRNSVMAADASNRYVAQQNIEPVTYVQNEILATFMKKHFKLGRFFRHVDMARGRLLLSKEMGQANPEDAEEQELMLETGQLVPTESVRLLSVSKHY